MDKEIISCIAFVDGLIDRLGQEPCLDLARVYVTGFSIGAAGTSVLGRVLDDRLAAVAPIGAVADLDETCSTARPVPVMAIQGIKDHRRTLRSWTHASTGASPTARHATAVRPTLRSSHWGRRIALRLGLSRRRPCGAHRPRRRPRPDIEHGRTHDRAAHRDFFEQHPMPE
jgi:pimeloyl-ACP methyl ester carboxylesterase